MSAVSRDTAIPALTAADVIGRLRVLPPMPAVVTDLLNTIEQPDVSATDIATKVARDQALAARTLRLANSSFFGLRQPVVTMRHAITVLGLRAVRTLIAAASVVGQLRPSARTSFDLEAFWRHSVAAAVSAGLLARQVRSDESAAFMGGLLHDVGRLVLVTCFPDRYAAVTAGGAYAGDVLEAEQAAFGLDHVGVGVELARHWNFPAVIAEAIGCHHQPPRDGPLTLVDLVCAADAFARSMGFHDECGNPFGPLEAMRARRVGLSPEGCVGLLEQAREQVEEISAVLVPRKR
jgi:putative nucleotidyltransferase with HDIG domain